MTGFVYSDNLFVGVWNSDDLFGYANIAVEYECNSAVWCNGFGLCGNACNVFFDYEQLKNLVKPIYIFAVAILLLVLVFGVSGDWGARSWIRFGAIGIQPSEIAKFAL